CVEVQIIGVTAYEADSIGPTRQLVRTIRFEGFEIGLADPQGVRDLAQLVAAPEPCAAQFLSDAFARRRFFSGYFAKMQPLGAVLTVQARNFSHHEHLTPPPCTVKQRSLYRAPCPLTARRPTKAVGWVLR